MPVYHVVSIFVHGNLGPSYSTELGQVEIPKTLAEIWGQILDSWSNSGSLLAVVW